MTQTTELGAGLWAGRDVLPVMEVVRAAGLSRDDVRVVDKAGLLRKLDRRGPKNAIMITREEAMFLLGVAALAIAAGMALVTMARLLRETGASVGPTGIVIPFPATNPAARLIA